MKLFIISMFFGVFAFSSAIYAKDVSIKELLPGYLAVQEALAADDFSMAQKKVMELDKQMKNIKGKAYEGLKVSLKAFQKTKSLSAARKEFKKISKPFVSMIESSKDSEFDIIYCPMAGAKWVQKRGEILNPYFGKEMLHCGEKAS